MFEVFTEFTFLNLLSVIAFLTTVGLFFCGIPICRQIWKRKDTNEISGAPFLMGVLGGTCWLTYGYLKKDYTVMYVTTAQVFLYSSYVVFYFFMTKKKFWISIKIAALVATCSALIACVYLFGQTVFHPLGIICMTLNTADFGAPLAGLKVVIRRRATSTLPLPLCIANFMVSTEWFIYGLLVHDFYLITPNGIGSVLAIAQLILFIVLPRKPGQQAPIVRLFYFLRRCGSRVKDIEADAVVPVEVEGNCKISKHRWSDRIVANVTNVTGEIENVIHKVHLGDPFAYSGKLNKTDDVSTDSATMTPESMGTPVEDKQMIFPPAFPLTITSEEQLMKVIERLQQQKNNISATVVDEIQEELPEETKAEKIKRCLSAPDLRKK
ncbi:hypothetical protein FO519_003585 [Halicephalobus sp. NKZ332]|nr:hypothetical protein FO519_003585 [Halicephalobus sp. NKZ332]